MSEGVTLICKPICECGYIFDSLKNILVEEQIGDHPIVGRAAHHYFEPSHCPKCGKAIELCATIDPNDDYNQTVTEDAGIRTVEQVVIRPGILEEVKGARNSREKPFL